MSPGKTPAKVAVIDGYIDDPAALGVPPYISPMIRAVAGAAKDADRQLRQWRDIAGLNDEE